MDKHHTHLLSHLQELQSDNPDMLRIFLLNRQEILLQGQDDCSLSSDVPRTLRSLITCGEHLIHTDAHIAHESIRSIVIRTDAGLLLLLPLPDQSCLLAYTNRRVLLNLTLESMQRFASMYQDMRESWASHEEPIVAYIAHHRPDEAARATILPEASLWTTAQTLVMQVDGTTMDAIRITLTQGYLSLMQDSHRHIVVDFARDVFELGRIYRIRFHDTV